MTVFLLLLTGLAAWGVVASLVVVARDGYRRQPVRTPECVRQEIADPAQAGPSDLAVSQWLPDRTRPMQSARGAGSTAGVMLMRPW